MTKIWAILATHFFLGAIYCSQINQQSARFYYEAEFEMVQINFDFKLITEPVNHVLNELAKIQKSTNDIKLSKTAILTRKYVFSEVEQYGQRILGDVGELRDFLNMGKKDFHQDNRSGRAPLEFMGQLWHDISGSPGPWEYKKELECLHRVEIAMTSLDKAEKIEGKEMSIIKSVLQKEQKEVEELSRSLKQLVSRYSNTQTDEIMLEVLISFRCQSLALLTKLDKKNISYHGNHGTG